MEFKIPSEPEMPAPRPASKPKAATPQEAADFEFRTAMEAASRTVPASEPTGEPTAESSSSTFGGEAPQPDSWGEEKKPESASAPAAQKSGGNGALIAAGLIFAIAIALYFTGALQMLTGVSGQAGEALPPIEVQSINGYYVENKNAGNVFVIEATIKNTTDSQQRISGVVGSVFDDKGTPLASRMTSPGRIVSKDDLGSMSKEDIVKSIKDTSGGVVQGRTTVPVMIVFVDPPAGISEMDIKVAQ